MRNTKVLILDVTRMRENRVCIAGVYKNQGMLRDVRPVSRFGNIERGFLKQPDGAIEPFTMMGFKLTSRKNQPPHVEDQIFEDRNPADFKIIGKLKPEKQREILEELSRGSLDEIFGPNVVEKRFIYEKERGLSLGCLKPKLFLGISATPGEEKINLRAGISLDEEKVFYPIVDLRLHSFFVEAQQRGEDLEKLKKSLNQRIRKSGRLYIRFGLTRPYRKPDDKDPDPRAKCYIQVLGIHSYPDYLDNWRIPDSFYSVE